MTRNPVTIRPRDSAASAFAILKNRKIRRLPVLDGRELVGIVSEYDLRRHLNLTPADLLPVEVVMTRNPVQISPQQTAEHAAMVMKEYRVGALPVVKHGTLVGIVCASDLMVDEPRPLPEWEPAAANPTIHVNDLYALRRPGSAVLSLANRKGTRKDSK
ncbi:MAG TPA: CBS domain-containing protein [Candidatus Binataceae bacterium]|nr:CBS domain-containing protein [Candidatus Binataceae bacterium]